MQGARSVAAILALAVSLAVSLAFAPGPAAAQVGKDEAAKQIAEEYGVEVLKTREGEIDGQPVWLITVMQQGGNSNSAFRVSTLAVSKQTGKLVPVFQHKSSGYNLPGEEAGVPRSANQPLNMQHGIWR